MDHPMNHPLNHPMNHPMNHNIRNQINQSPYQIQQRRIFQHKSKTHITLQQNNRVPESTMVSFQIDYRSSLWITHSIHPNQEGRSPDPSTDCRITLVDGTAEICGCPMIKNQSLDIKNHRDVLIDTDSGCIVIVVTERFCFISEQNSRKCRRRQVRDYCRHPRSVTMIVSEGTETIETMYNEFVRLGTPCLMVDLDGRSDVLTPKYTVGTASSQYFHSPTNLRQAQALSPGLYSRIASQIQDFQQCGGVVLINAFSCQYSSSHKEFLRSVESLSVEQVGVVDSSDLFHSVREEQLLSKVGLSELFPWPNLKIMQTRPERPHPEDIEEVCTRIRGIVRHLPMAPRSCLPIGYVRQLTDSFQVDLTCPTKRPQGLFGITQSVPTVETLSMVGYTTLIRSTTRGLEVLAGDLPVTGDLYFVTWAPELTFHIGV
jgi:hypothetical protein